MRWLNWTLINNQVHLGCFSVPAEKPCKPPCVSVLLPGYSLPQSMAYFCHSCCALSVLRLVTVCFMPGHCLLEDAQPILDSLLQIQPHIVSSYLSCNRAFVPEWVLPLHCLSSESLPNNYTPAAPISATAVSVGLAVISDNGGHFLDSHSWS